MRSDWKALEWVMAGLAYEQAPPADRATRLAAWRAIRPDFRKVAYVAGETRQLGRLHTILADCPDPPAPADFIDYAALVHGAIAETNQHLLTVLDQVAGRFAARGWRPLLLKGGALLLDGTYPDPGERMVGDMDLLLPEAQADDAQALMLAEGWRPLVVWPRATRMHHLVPLTHDALGAKLEIHTCLSLAPGADAILPPVDMMARGRPHILPGGATILLPTAEDHIRHRLIHDRLNQHDAALGRIDMRGLADLARLAPRVDWPTLAAGPGADLLASWVALAVALTGLPRPPALPAADAGPDVARLRRRWILPGLRHVHGAAYWMRETVTRLRRKGTLWRHLSDRDSWGSIGRDLRRRIGR